MSANPDTFAAVFDLVSAIPAGKVATYGDIAKILAINPRYVGYILHYNPAPGIVPCHRVVSASGKVAQNFAFGGGDAQQKLLEDEGIIFEKGRLDLDRHRHCF